MILNTNIRSGEKIFTQLPELLKEYGFKYPCVLVDKNLYNNSKYVSNVLDNLLLNDRLLLYDYPFEPSYQMLDEIMEKISAKNIIKNVDVWIGIGGGSAMDTAKGLAILSKNSGPSIKYKGFPVDLNEPLPVIAIPSTTGTGSEVVYNASFIDEESKIKMGINYEKNYPICSILDPLVPSNAPLNVLASSGCDALVHSLESFVSKQANDQVKSFSKLAYRLIISNMIPILKNSGTIQNWHNMQWAAVYAMFALSNSTSGPTGALSYYLGTNFKVNHGMAGGVFIGKICKYNHENGYYELSKLYDEADREKLNNKEKSLLVIQQIHYLLKIANIPESLTQFLVKEKDLQGFNKFALKSKTAFEFNPVKIDPNKVADLFIKI